MASGFHGYHKVSGSEINLAISETNHAAAAGNPRSDESSYDCAVREQDRFMPIANVIRIMRKILPPHAKISDDAKETIQECVSEYISFITGEANERCQCEQRKTITAEDVLWAMSKLGFDNYIEPLTVYLHRYRELEGDRGSLRGEPLIKRTPPPAAAPEYAGVGVPGFHQMSQHGYYGSSATYSVAGGYYRDGINHDGTPHAPTANGETHQGRQLHYFLSTLVIGYDDRKSDPGSKKDDKNVTIVISVLQNIKRSEDVVDAAKTKKPYALCDLGLFIVKKLTGVEVSVSEGLCAVPLPSMLYRSCDIHEGQREVSEGKTWLADENALAHFESLETENSNLLDIVEDEDSKITRDDEKELPLGKMMKRLKSRGTKRKKEKRESLTEEIKAENDLDVLNMVWQINLDTMDICGRVESINGHELRHPKKVRKVAGAGANESGDDGFLVDSALLISSSPKASISSKRSGKDFPHDHAGVHEWEEVLYDDDKRSRGAEETENVDTRKAKAMMCISKEGENILEDLTGCRIKVWWPMDKQFYESTAKSYDLSRNRHVVLYDDGDVEIFNLEKEKWEIVNKRNKFAKKDKVLSASRGLNDSEKMKRTPKKTSRQKKRVQEETDSGKEGKGVSDLADAEMASDGIDDQIKRLGDYQKERRSVNGEGGGVESNDGSSGN
ncbi:hypothetical protein MLD38_009943 [Melastoma candidum]|uniref:Uncharacterized protein n=1 Tax=Melastoma candidum TaxID=119954 RepID=A0ACB9QYT7_9MYRT|nr:hypothetical protein MLD38_009943 [Melastoma candidum]